MKCYCRTTICAIVIGVASSFITFQVISQPDPAEMDMEAMMQHWMEMAQPDEHHQKMAEQVGTWTQHTKHWMSPDQPPTESKARAEISTIMGGRFMVEKVKGNMEIAGQVQQMDGMGIFGYDRMQEKHVFVWMDNLGTMMMYGEGTEDADGTITYYSKLPGFDGGSMMVKTVTREVNKDEHHVEMFNQMPDGAWWKNMEISMTRNK